MNTIRSNTGLDFGYEIFISVISVISIFNMIFTIIPDMDDDAINVIHIINSVITLLFIYDFFIRFFTVPSKLHYFIHNYGWADLLAIIPLFRILKLPRIYYTKRMVQKRGSKHILSYFSQYRAESAVYILVIMVILIIEGGAILVLKAEQASSSANIISATDAIWWVYVTITTTGYGDYYPVTAVGRLVGILVLTTGVAVFATFTGYISSKILTSPDKKDIHQISSSEESDQKTACLAELQKLIRERDDIEKKITICIKNLEDRYPEDNPDS